MKKSLVLTIIIIMVMGFFVVKSKADAIKYMGTNDPIPSLQAANYEPQFDGQVHFCMEKAPKLADTEGKDFPKAQVLEKCEKKQPVDGWKMDLKWTNPADQTQWQSGYLMVIGIAPKEKKDKERHYFAFLPTQVTLKWGEVPAPVVPPVIAQPQPQVQTAPPAQTEIKITTLPQPTPAPAPTAPVMAPAPAPAATPNPNLPPSGALIPIPQPGQPLFSPPPPPPAGTSVAPPPAPPAVAPTPPAAQSKCEQAVTSELLFIGGEINACFSFTETKSNSLGIEENYKPVTLKECGVVTSVAKSEDGKFLVSIDSGKKKFNKIPLCILEGINSGRPEAKAAFNVLKNKNCL